VQNIAKTKKRKLFLQQNKVYGVSIYTENKNN